MTLVKSKSKKKMFHITASRGYTEAGKLCPCFLCLMCTLYLFVLKKPQKLPVPPPRAIPFKKNPVHAHDKQDGF